MLNYKKYFTENLASNLLVLLVIFWVSLNIAQNILNFLLATILTLLILPATFKEKLTFKSLKPFSYLSIYFFITKLISEINLSFLPKNSFFTDILGNSEKPSLLSFLDLPLLIFALVIVVAPSVYTFYKGLFKIILNSKFLTKNALTLNVGVSILLAAFYSVIMLLDHLSFRSHAYDFGLHDQNFYMLSHLKFPPVSTIHQINNLWMDHQHFSQILISPLFIIGNGFNGRLLVILTPFILIFIPSIFIFLSFQKINNYFKLTTHKHYWLISVTTFLMWLHPATQSAVRFYFHERYLTNLFIPIVVYFIVSALTSIKRQNFFLALATLFTIFWFGVKEDQWIFALVFWLQIGFWVFFVGKNIWDKSSRTRLLVFSIINIFASLLYSSVILKNIRGNNALTNHLAGYNLIITSLSELFKTGNFYKFWESMQFLSPDRAYLYQNYFIFDFLGNFFLPFNVMGNYFQRLINSNPFIRSTGFQYGSDLPLYSSLGFVFLIILVLRFKPKFLSRLVVAVVLIYIFGSLAVSGNNGYYLILSSPKVVKVFMDSKEERLSFSSVTKDIPNNASIVTSGFYTSQLSSRDKIINWPKTENITGDVKRTDVDVYSYNYWLIPNTKSWQFNNDFKDKIKELKTANYKILKETDYQILFELNPLN